jgi:biopolymer transport protein ExbD
MAVGAKGGVNHDINVTPLIDVVLVLLIIFMVLTPMMQKAHQVNLPAPPDPVASTTPPPPSSTQLILSMDKDKAIFLNQDLVEKADLPKRVKEILGGNPSKILFFKCDPSIAYGEAVNVMDLCRGAGAERIGIITEELKKAAEGEVAAPEDPAAAAEVPPA